MAPGTHVSRKQSLELCGTGGWLKLLFLKWGRKKTTMTWTSWTTMQGPIFKPSKDNPHALCGTHILYADLFEDPLPDLLGHKANMRIAGRGTVHRTPGPRYKN